MLLKPRWRQVARSRSWYGLSLKTSTFSTSLRAFSTSLTHSLKLAYDLYEPPKDLGAPRGRPIIFIHGLFGSKKNNRSMSKVLARDLNRDVYAIDLRNHGDSPHNAQHDYTILGADVEEFIDEHKLAPATLIGHSMGGKTAMTVALHNPKLVDKLISVDHAPVDAVLRSDFGKYIQGMKMIEEAKLQKLSEADEMLKPYEESLAVRQFLLTNLVNFKDESGRSCKKFRVPLQTIANSLGNMADFPYKDPEEVRYEGPALFARGTKSHYVADDTLPAIGRFFPRFELKDIEAGHWIISENPHAFREVAVEFLSDKT